MDYLLVSVIQFILWPVKIKVSKHFVAFPSIDFHLSNIVGCFSLITHHIWNSLVDGSVHLKSVNSTKFAQTTNYTVQTLQTVLYKHRLFYIILCSFFWVCAVHSEQYWTSNGECECLPFILSGVSSLFRCRTPYVLMSHLHSCRSLLVFIGNIFITFNKTEYRPDYGLHR